METSWEKIFDTVGAAETKQAEYKPIKEGKYMGFIDGAKINEAREPNQVSLTWKIVSEGPSEFANRLVFSNYGLTAEGIAILKKDLSILGHGQVSASTLRSTLEKLIGIEAEIYVKPKPVGDKTYYNVYINELLTKGIDKNDQIPF